jgi:hypothetical protein
MPGSHPHANQKGTRQQQTFAHKQTCTHTSTHTKQIIESAGTIVIPHLLGLPRGVNGAGGSGNQNELTGVSLTRSSEVHGQRKQVLRSVPNFYRHPPMPSRMPGRIQILPGILVGRMQRTILLLSLLLLVLLLLLLLLLRQTNDLQRQGVRLSPIEVGRPCGRLATSRAWHFYDIAELVAIHRSIHGPTPDSSPASPPSASLRLLLLLGLLPPPRGYAPMCVRPHQIVREDKSPNEAGCEFAFFFKHPTYGPVPTVDCVINMHQIHATACDRCTYYVGSISTVGSPQLELP